MCDQMITHAAMTHGSNGWMPVNIVFPPMVRRAINLLFDNQPMASVHFTEDSSAYRTIMEYLSKHEGELSQNSGSIMRLILLRNANLMQKVRLELESSRNQRSPNSSGRNDYHVVDDYRNRSLGSRGVTPMNLARSYSLLILPLPCRRVPVFASYRPYWFSFQP